METNKDLFEKYQDKIENADESKSFTVKTQIFNDFLDQTVNSCEDRKINSWAEAQDVLKAQDEKWRALCKRFEKANGKKVLSDNAFADRVLEAVPKAFKYARRNKNEHADRTEH